MKSEDAAVIFSSLKQDDNLIVAEGNRPFWARLTLGIALSLKYAAQSNLEQLTQ